MNDLVAFTFNQAPVRILMDEHGGPWFIAKDVCVILAIQNHRDTLAKSLDADEKGVAKVYTPGGTQEMTTISESGLYTLIMRSNKPQAKTFRKWVTSEVLPSIRKTGSYSTRAETVDIDQVPLIHRRAISKTLNALARKVSDKPRQRAILSESLFWLTGQHFTHLFQSEPVDQAAASNTDDTLASTLTADIAARATSAWAFTLTGRHGLYSNRRSLTGPLQTMTRRDLEGLAHTLLAEGRIQQVDSRDGRRQILTVPDRPSSIKS